jgi:hypothetical protein
MSLARSARDRCGISGLKSAEFSDTIRARLPLFKLNQRRRASIYSLN